MLFFNEIVFMLCNSVARTMGKLVRNYLHTNHLKKKVPYTIHRNNGITKITKNQPRVSDCVRLEMVYGVFAPYSIT